MKAIEDKKKTDKNRKVIINGSLATRVQSEWKSEMPLLSQLSYLCKFMDYPFNFSPLCDFHTLGPYAIENRSTFVCVSR